MWLEVIQANRLATWSNQKTQANFTVSMESCLQTQRIWCWIIEKKGNEFESHQADKL